MSVVVPLYPAILLLKGMNSVARLVRPFAALLPDWIPAEDFFSLLSPPIICTAYVPDFVIGVTTSLRSETCE